MRNRHIVVLAVTLLIAAASVLPAAAQPSQPPYRLFLPAVYRGREPLKPTADAFVFENGPNVNTGSAAVLTAGNDQEEPNPLGIMRSFVYFETPTIEPALVYKAVLRLYYQESADFENTNRGIHVYALGQPWQEMTVTWANQPWWNHPVGDITINSSAAPGYVDLDVTDQVRLWVSTTQRNYGFSIEGPESAGSDWAYRVFGSRESAHPPELSLYLLN